jgi:hypothetical protein
MPAWLPVAAGVAVVALAAVVVATVAGGGGRSGITSGPAAVSTTEATTTIAATTTSAATTTTTTTVPEPEAGGSWTVLVYGLGDNNLEAALLRDLEEMTAVPPAALSFVVLADRSPEYTDEALPGIGDWDTAKVLSVGPGGFTEEADLGELNLGDPAVLTDFVTRTIAGHPADHYALVLWNHGSPAGVGSDESHGDVLSTPEIAAGARAGLDAAGVPRFDLIGFDACLMGAYEVAASVAPLADYMVASEELEPNEGWDYSAFGILAEQPDTVTALGLGREIVSRFLATSAVGDSSITMSLLDLSQVGGLVASLDALNEAIAPDMATFASTIGRGRNQSPSYGSSPIPEEDFYMVDLGGLLQNLIDAEAPLGDAAAAVLDALEQVVVASEASPAAGPATGLTVHFPPYADYYIAEWYRSTGSPVWPEFLDAYYAAGAAIPEEAQPSFAPVGNQAGFYFDDFGLNVDAVFDQGAVENIVEAVLYTGVVADDGTVTFVGEGQGLYAGNQAIGANPLNILILDDGEDQAVAYQDISYSEDYNLIILDVPLAYYPPESDDQYQDIILHLTYNATTAEFTEGFFVFDESGTIGEFEADPAGLIVPRMLEWYPDGTTDWVQTSDVGLWADLPNLLYDFQDLDPGTHIYAELQVYDYGGNWDYAYVDTVIPAGEAAWATCSNTTWSFQVSYPSEWFVWDSPTPDLDCAYFDPSPMEGLAASEAFDQATLTVEVYEGTALDDAVAFFGEYSVAQEEVEVAGLTATVYESAQGEWGFRAFVAPLWPDPGAPALVLAAWGEVDESLVALADRVAGSLLFAD